MLIKIGNMLCVYVFVCLQDPGNTSSSTSSWEWSLNRHHHHHHHHLGGKTL